MEKTIWNKWQRNEKEEATLKLFLLYLFNTREFQSSSRIIQKTEKHHHPIELSSHFEFKKWKEKKNWSSNQFCRPTIIRCHLLLTVSMTVYQKSTVAFTKDLGFNQNVQKKKKNSAKNILTYTSPDGNCMAASPTRWYHNQQSKYRIDLFVLPIYTSEPHIQCLTISTIAELLHMITNTCCWSIEHGSVPGFA